MSTRGHSLPGVGIAFHDFGDEAEAKDMAAAFHAGLAATAMEDEDAVVGKAKRAFEWHRELFEEFAASRAPRS